MDRRPSLRFLLFWHTLVAGLLFLVADLRVPDTGFWSARTEEYVATVFLLGAYVLTALTSIVACVINRPMRLSMIVATSLAIFGAAFFLLLMAPSVPPYSRALLIAMFGAALVLAAASAMADRFGWLALGLLLVCTASLGAVSIYKAVAPMRQPEMSRTARNIATALHAVELETYADPVPKSIVRGGAIAIVGDRYLLATGDGRLYAFAWPAGGQLEKPRPLPIHIPFNLDEFVEDSDTDGSGIEPGSSEADAVKGIQTWQFRVADVLVKSSGDRVRVFASHHYWKRTDKCFTVRVSALDAEREALLAGKADDVWQTIFEATPCLPLEGPDALRSNNPFGGMEIGGQMALVDDDTLLLTVGDHAFSGVGSSRMLAQEPESLYGKTVLIHLQDNSKEIFTSGHRNPQGLFVDPDGTLWETEHGQQGGDEINILRQGSNYGWPLVTYGTDYGAAVWPLNSRQGHHDGFVPPIFAWVPSIGVSSLVRLQLDGFPSWKDDLLVASLHDRALYRVHLEEQRAVFAEPIQIGDRIRDIVEGPDGQILMWTDSYNLMSLHQAVGSTGDVLFGTRCGTCHKIDKGTNNSFGPDLYGIVGRKAGSNSTFDGYSPALKAFGKTWTKQTLDKFLENPQALVPGTLMNFPVPDAEERQAIVAYLDRTDD